MPQPDPFAAYADLLRQVKLRIEAALQALDPVKPPPVVFEMSAPRFISACHWS